MTFKQGDRVTCIEGDPDLGLYPGMEYLVEGVDTQYAIPLLGVRARGSLIYVRQSRFEETLEPLDRFERDLGQLIAAWVCDDTLSREQVEVALDGALDDNAPPEPAKPEVAFETGKPVVHEFVFKGDKLGIQLTVVEWKSYYDLTTTIDGFENRQLVSKQMLLKL